MPNSNADILLAGAVAAFTVDLLIYPLDTIKTRLQSPDYHRVYVDGATRAVRRGLLFGGLYQGVGSVIVATLPASGAFFTTYEATKTGLKRQQYTRHLPTPLLHAIASSVAELISCVILTPAEVLKQNAQMIRRSTNTTATSLHQIKNSPSLRTLQRFSHSPSRLWRGYTALAARNLPFTAIQFPLFEALKPRTLSSSSSSSSSSPLQTTLLLTSLSAGLAGSIAALVTTPIDVVKTRIMLSSSPSSHNDRNTWSTATRILHTEGLPALWRGAALRTLWTAVGSALYLGSYEAAKLWLAVDDGSSSSS